MDILISALKKEVMNHRGIAIYGCGKMAKETYDALLKCAKRPEFCVVSQKLNGDECFQNEIPIYEFSKQADYIKENDILVIIGVSALYEKEIEELNAVIEAQMKKAEKARQPEIELAPEISIDEFFKTELRAAKVIECEKVKKSKKLLKLQLDDGMGGRQVVSGIASCYSPEDMLGKTVILVANLKPAKLCGEVSMGMICAADLPDDKIKVIFLDDDIAPGTKIR